MNQTPWASTDLRYRYQNNIHNNTSRSSVQETPNSQASRGFLEDYGDEQSKSLSGSLTHKAWWCCWRQSLRCRHCQYRVNATLLATIVVAASVASIQFATDVNDTGLFGRWATSVASFCTIVLALYLLYQQRTLRKLGTFRQQHNKLRQQVYYLRQERERLHRTLDRMDEAAAELHHVPQELHRLTKDPNLIRMMSLVQEHDVLQQQIRQTIHQKVMEQILSLVVQGDRDQNWTLSPLEIEKLVVRLGLVENIEFNEVLFRQALTEDPTVSSVMRIIRSLLEGDGEYPQPTIFRVNPPGVTTSTTILGGG